MRARAQLAAAVAALLLPTPAAAGSPLPDLTRLVPSPNVGARDNELAAVATVPQNLTVAVGFWRDAATGDRRRTLVQHWSGRGWRLLPSPNATGFDNALRGVAGVAATDVWAVGSAATDDGAAAPTRTLIERFDGQTWRVVPSPAPGAEAEGLNGVAALAASDVWAVGGAGTRTLALHWTDTEWTRVPTPDPGVDNRLTAVAGTGPDDVWAVGETRADSGPARPLILHWTGQRWHVTPVPATGPDDTVLTAVSAVSPTDAWVVGTVEGGAARPLVLHWDGVAWQHVSTVDAEGLDLTGVTASPTRVWAIGYAYGPGGDTDPVILRLTALGWAWCPTAQPNDLVSAAGGIAPATGGGVWAVGHHQVTERADVASTLVLQSRTSGTLRC